MLSKTSSDVLRWKKSPPWGRLAMNFQSQDNGEGAVSGRTASRLPACLVLGLMSGTSLDGVDAVLARLTYGDGHLEWRVVARKSVTYPPELRERLLQAMDPEHATVVLITQLHAEVGQVYAQLAGEFQDVDLIALSGQTVYHIPRTDASRGWRTRSTLQLGEAALVAEQCRVPVISDFRQSDMAAGGQGAPLVAFGDLMLYHQQGTARAVHNLGGISNLTYLPANGDANAVFAFDTGPANCLVDEAVARFYAKDFDEGGKVAASGTVVPEVLERLMQHPYLRMSPPKTTGREVFRLLEFEAFLACQEPKDVVATLTAFTAESVERAYREFVLPKGLDEVLIAGGGSLNPTLIRMLRERLPVTVRTFGEAGWNAKDREALAFAVMAYFAYHGHPNTLPGATGAQRPVVAGKLTCH
jgi:anhydro-N-acetylmuramic acid kinase